MVVIVSISKLDDGRIQVGVAKPQHNSKPVQSYLSQKEARKLLIGVLVSETKPARDAFHRNTRFQYVTQKDLLPGVWQVAQTSVTCLINSPELPGQTMRLMR